MLGLNECACLAAVHTAQQHGTAAPAAAQKARPGPARVSWGLTHVVAITSLFPFRFFV
jgi:hypothetical protein